MNTFSLYKQGSADYSVADSLAGVFAAQEIEHNTEKLLNSEDITNPAVKSALVEFPAENSSIVNIASNYRWLDKSGKSIMVDKKAGLNEYNLFINHALSGLFSKSEWKISDRSGLNAIASVVNSLVGHSEQLEVRNPKLGAEVDAVLAFIETKFLKKAKDLNWADEVEPESYEVDMSESDLPIDIDMSEDSEGAKDEKPFDIDDSAFDPPTEVDDADISPLDDEPSALEPDRGGVHAKAKKRMFMNEVWE